MSPSPLQAFLVEDEPLCRADFRQTLRAFPELRLVGEADHLAAARKFLVAHPVDLLFLDISVGRDHGLDLLSGLPHPPLVIALTAHPQHAAQGFALDLVDYILKPIEENRLRAALVKARQRKLAAPLAPGRTTFLAEMDGKKTVLEATDILGAESMGNYVLLQTIKGKAITRATFKQVRQKLPSPLFLEIARGRLLARHHITGWQRDSGGRLLLHLAFGPPAQVSRNHASRIQRFLAGEKSDASLSVTGL